MKQTSGKINQTKGKTKINNVRNEKRLITADVVEILKKIMSEYYE